MPAASINRIIRPVGCAVMTLPSGCRDSSRKFQKLQEVALCMGRQATVQERLMNNVSSPKTDGSCQDTRLTRLLFFGLLIADSQRSNSLKHVISQGGHLATLCEPFFGIFRLAGTSEFARRLSLCIFFNLVQWVKLGISTKHGVELASDVKWQMRWRQARIVQPDAKPVAWLRGALSEASPSMLEV